MGAATTGHMHPRAHALRDERESLVLRAIVDHGVKELGVLVLGRSAVDVDDEIVVAVVDGLEGGAWFARGGTTHGCLRDSSETLTYSHEFPAMSTRSRGNRALNPNALPVRRWHAKQWHMETRKGAPSATNRN